MKGILVLLVRLFFLGTVTWAFFGGPFCWLSVKAQGLVWGAVATLLLGRFFCQAVCPLGIVQTFVNALFHPKRHVRRVCTRLPETRVQLIVRWSLVVVCVALAAVGFMGPVTMLLPISIFGKAVTLWTPGVVMAAVVVVLSIFGDGRLWCNWVCPFGAIYSLLARVSLCKNKVTKRCGNCRKCFGEKVCSSCKSDGDVASPADGVTRRETLKGVAVLAAADKLTDGGLAAVSLPGVPEREHDVLPPGAEDRRVFSLKCVGCQLCVTSCPGQCLRPSVKLSTFGQPRMDFRHGYCISNCVKCGEVCPEGAIMFLQRERRPHVHMGHAIWKKDLCVRATGEKCTACVRKCPVQAIHLVQGFPVVDRATCIGCGACEHVCPARPLPAIYVKGFEMQRIVNPIAEGDLLAEMKSRIAAGAAVVIARNGVIVAEETGRGIGPLLKLHDEGKLRGAIVVDKVIGRAAAAICLAGGAKRVYTMLAAKGAAELLAREGISLEAEKTVDVILNRDKSGSCPMEKAVSGLDEPEKMIEAIRKAMKR